MKKKGFTLVELLGVIVLLGILGLIVYPTIAKVIKDNKQKLYEKQISELKRIVYNYSVTNDLGYEDNVEKTISFDVLIDKGYISSKDIRNPKTGESLNGCMSYKWLDSIKQYEINYKEDCVVKNPEQIELEVTFNTNNTPNNNWYKENIYVNISINGATSYKWCGTTSSTCEPNSLVNSNTGSALINTESDSNVICVIAYDSEGNYTNTVCSDVYKLDKTGPSFAGLFDNTVIKGTDFDVRDGVNVKDDLSGLDGNFTVTPESIDTSRIGSTTLTYTATDNAGNTTTATRLVTIEGNAPVITFNPVTSPNTNGWYKNNFNVEINVVDDSGLGISSESWCETIEESCTPSNNGTTATVTLESSNVKVCATATDGSGKSTTSCSETYKLDKTLPYFTGISDETIQKGETFDVRNGVTVNDALSLVDGTFTVSPTSVDTSKAGTTVLTYSTLDKAGNTKEITRTIVVDAEGPSITFTPTTEPNSNGWYNSTFFLNINVTDNSGLGIKETKWCGTLDNTCTPTTSGTTAQVSLEGSSTRICAQSTDNNNKTSEVICSDGYKLDITAPSKPSITGGSNSYVTSASISLSTESTDLTSGGITYEYYVTNSSDSPTTSTTATGTYTSPMTFNTNRAGDYMYVRAKDQSGNIGEWSDVQRLYIDINDPTISAKGNSYTITEGDSNVISSTYFNIDKNGNASISSTTCTSNIDGTVSNTSSLSVGTHTITCTVTKSTNKTANASATITVESAGVDIGGQKVQLVTTGDGLYEDDDGVYRYKGANPNNYIMLGTEEYRIMAIENQGIKVIRSSSYTTSGFDAKDNRPAKTNTYSGSYTYNNVWSPANEISQNGTISATITNGSYSGTVTIPSTAYTVLHDTYYSSLSSVDKYIVKDATWNVGPITYASTMLLTTVKDEENNWTWNGKIALMTYSEYIQAQSTSSSGYSSCSSNIYNNTSCGTDNWLKPSSNICTITPYASHSGSVWIVSSNGTVYSHPANNSDGLRPVVYLTSDIKLQGSGTPSQPYEIVIPPTTAETLKQNTVTTGDGLYADSDGIYRYKGENPNNYITLGTETYRIMAIEPQGIKVIRSANVTDSYWDSSNKNTWNGSTAQTYLYNTYYSNLSSVQSYIVEDAIWNIGSVTLADTMKLSTIKTEEAKSKWTGKIAMMTYSEFIQGQSLSSSGYSSCLANIRYNTNCGITNWLNLSNYTWTITPQAGRSDLVWTLYKSGGIEYNALQTALDSQTWNDVGVGIRPVVILKPNIQLSGLGTSGQPFTIVG